jgi:hypothetical protein
VWTVIRRRNAKEEAMTAQLMLDPVITAHIAAISTFDVDAIMDTFAADALVNDFSREFWGTDHATSTTPPTTSRLFSWPATCSARALPKSSRWRRLPADRRRKAKGAKSPHPAAASI